MRPIYLISKTPYPGVIHIPVLSIRFLTPDIDFSDYEGVILTSKQGVEALRRYDVPWDKLGCICVSEPTAVYARSAGAQNVETGSGYGTSIPDILGSRLRHGKWLYLRPEKVASFWVEEARARGFLIDEAIVYETRCAEGELPEPVDERGVLIFTSPSSIECFLQKSPILPTHRVIAIGKTTKKALPEGTESLMCEETSVASAVELARKITQMDENSSPF